LQEGLGQTKTSAKVKYIIMRQNAANEISAWIFSKEISGNHSPEQEILSLTRWVTSMP
jgi:frataxin-like iron-binding protein CyaY